MVKKRILVVDDDKEIARLLRGYLQQAGYDVLVGYDGETAVHTLRHHPHYIQSAFLRSSNASRGPSCRLRPSSST